MIVVSSRTLLALTSRIGLKYQTAFVGALKFVLFPIKAFGAINWLSVFQTAPIKQHITNNEGKIKRPYMN